MEIGNQIKTLRTQRGVTQETVAAALGVLPQTVSKWETGATAPDIALLPAISAYFGVTIDELFALTDQQRVERIENMLDNQREVEAHILDREAAFLLEKARREPKNARVWSLLAYVENHRGDAAKRKAAEYAKESLSRKADNNAALWELARATGLEGPYWELADSHRAVIDYLKDFIAENPDVEHAYWWLMDALLLDSRFAEASQVCDRLSRLDKSKLTDPIRVPDYRGLIAWKSGDRETALRIWDDMVRDLPEDDSYGWGVYAQDYAMTGDYARAARLTLRCGEHMAPPRATWVWEQGAYFQELAGDIQGAIASLEQLLEVRRADYNVTTGAGNEAYLAEIDRLRAKL